MTDEEIQSIREQIARQTIERQHYADAIAAQTDALKQAQAAAQPEHEKLADLEAQLATLQANIEQQRAVVAKANEPVAAEASKLDALTSNADALDRAILGCKVLIGEQ